MADARLETYVRRLIEDPEFIRQCEETERTWNRQLRGLDDHDALVPDCVTCRIYFEDNAMHLVAACASVGIERGKPIRQMVAEYMAALHREHKVRGS